ncbi:response regulator transcription factor [Alcaligenaceae bacterium A4P071]|nr:response regulator transcription factor [Alcaligenaceae bacterium A4P071]
MPKSSLANIRVVLLDGHDVVRQGLAVHIACEHDIQIVGSYRRPAALLNAVDLVNFDVIITEFVFGVGDADGNVLLRQLRRKFALAAILVLSNCDEGTTKTMACQAGANGVIGKQSSLNTIVDAVRHVATGGYVYPALTHGAVWPVPAPAVAARATHVAFLGALLTPQECEVVRCLLSGLSVSDIALKFSRSQSTVGVQKFSAYRKLGVCSDWGLFELWKFSRRIQSGNLNSHSRRRGA